ncbi:YkvA family protein [Plantactinospora sp. BB1]|uniref:YkvA family protein n=1 Tax=Plantactinospora sp. BB1 TaxID=2071627 RepID=UPI001F17B87A|nr:YkvA family protein [Plantactinospora sp. BB1]
MSRDTWTVILVLGGIVAVATLAGAVVLALRVLRTRKLLGELGAGGKVAFYGALIYTVLPVDLLPDPIYLDDMGILAGALLYLTRLVHQRRAGRPGSLDHGVGADVRPLPPRGPDRTRTRR